MNSLLASKKITGKIKPPKPVSPETIVVIGNGMVGHKLLERLVEFEVHSSHHIIVFGEEPRPAYDRISLTQFFEGRHPDSLLLATRDWYRENRIVLHTGDPVITINRNDRTVRSRKGTEVRYDQLVFATGSRPFVPDIEGRDLPGVFVYRTIEDVEKIHSFAASLKSATVLGGGLLGLEAAKALYDMKLETHVVEHGWGLMSRQLTPEASAVLKSKVEELGVITHLHYESTFIRQAGNRLELGFSNGEKLETDMVVIAAGIRPRDELAKECGLKLGPRGGIEINDKLQTSDPNICAIGECAAHRGMIYGLAAPGYKMADALAQRLRKKRATFKGDDQSARLKLLGVHVSTLGEFQQDGHYYTKQSEQSYRQIVIRRGKLVGASAVGDWDELNRLQEAVESRRRLWPWQVRRFERTGTIWPKARSLNVASWPKNALVCNCKGLTRGVLSDAIKSNGCASIESLAKCTGASTVCGSCRPLLAELVGVPVGGPRTRGYLGLAVASFLAIVLVPLIAMLTPVSFAQTVQLDFHFDFLWRDSFWRLTTGYTLLGVCVLSLALSFRKRIKFLPFGDYGLWRMVHSILGAIALLAVATHTGLRLGQNLNFILMMNFLSLAILGGLAGGVVALESQMTAATLRRFRSIMTGLHIALFWPLPTLLFFHVFKVYYY